MNLQSDDDWWASLPPDRKAQVRRWLDRDSEDAHRDAAAKHPEQLTLPLEVTDA